MGENAQELVYTTESIQIESRERVSLGKRRLQEKDQLCESSRKTKKLRKEMDETRNKLELKEQELHFLRQQERHQRDNADLRVVIAEKEAEIKFLKEKLSELESELNSEKVRNKELCERLEQTTVKLSKKSERVRGLKKRLAELERERRQVDTRIIIETARRMVIIDSLSITNHMHTHTHTHTHTHAHAHAHAQL